MTEEIEAMRQLAALLEPTHPGDAEHWYGVGASSGDPASMCQLARLLYSPDHKTAKRWYERAAEAGNQSARDTLLRLYPWSTPFRVIRNWWCRPPRQADYGVQL